MKMRLSLLAIMALIAGSSALVITRSKDRTRTPPGFHLDPAVADNEEDVVAVTDADVVPYASMAEPTSSKQSLAQVEQNRADAIKDDSENRIQSNSADADGWEVVRVVEADVVNDTSKDSANVSNAEKNRAVDDQRGKDGNMDSHERKIVSARNNNSKIEGKSDQEDNDDNDEDDAGGDVMQGPTKPRASVVQVQAPNINITAVVAAAKEARSAADSVLHKDVQAKRSFRSSQNKSEVTHYQSKVQHLGEAAPATTAKPPPAPQVVAKTEANKVEVNHSQSKNQHNAKVEASVVTSAMPPPATQVVRNTIVTEAPPEQKPVDASPETQIVVNTEVTEAPPQEQMSVDMDPQVEEIPVPTDAPPPEEMPVNAKIDCTTVSLDGNEFNENNEC